MAIGYSFEHDTRSVFGDFDSMSETNRSPHPSLLLDGGSTLIDSHGESSIGSTGRGRDRPLVRMAGCARAALQRIALASGGNREGWGGAYERNHPSRVRSIGRKDRRCRTQGEGAIAGPRPPGLASDAAHTRPITTIA